MSRLLSTVATAVLLVSACSSSSTPASTLEPIRASALEYAVSAERALADTRFEGRDPEWLADLVLSSCEQLQPGEDGAALLAALVLGAAAEVEPVEAAEDRILVEVVVTGVVEVCPGEFAGATTSTAVAPDPETDYLRAVVPVGEESGLVAAGITWLEAGWAVCRAVDEGEGPERGLLEAASLLFGVSEDSLAELGERGALLAADGAVLGSVLGAAAAYLCPHNGDTVMSYIAVLEASG